MKNVQKMSKRNLVPNFPIDNTKEIDFCETCISGKHPISPFPTSGYILQKNSLVKSIGIYVKDRY